VVAVVFHRALTRPTVTSRDPAEKSTSTTGVPARARFQACRRSRTVLTGMQGERQHQVDHDPRWEQPFPFFCGFRFGQHCVDQVPGGKPGSARRYR